MEGVQVLSHKIGQSSLGFGRVEYDKLDNLVAFENDANTILHHPIHRFEVDRARKSLFIPYFRSLHARLGLKKRKQR